MAEAKFKEGERVKLPSERGGGIGVVVEPSPLTLDGDWWYVVRTQGPPQLKVFALFDEDELEPPD